MSAHVRYFRTHCPDYIFVFSVSTEREDYMMPTVMPCICGQQHYFTEITAFEYDSILDEDLDGEDECEEQTTDPEET